MQKEDFINSLGWHDFSILANLLLEARTELRSDIHTLVAELRAPCADADQGLRRSIADQQTICDQLKATERTLARVDYMRESFLLWWTTA